jgi:hypothetical protein
VARLQPKPLATDWGSEFDNSRKCLEVKVLAMAYARAMAGSPQGLLKDPRDVADYFSVMSNYLPIRLRGSSVGLGSNVTGVRAGKKPTGFPVGSPAMQIPMWSGCRKAQSRRSGFVFKSERPSDQVQAKV